MASEPLTPAMLADALDCAWNAAIGAAHEQRSPGAMDTASVIASAFSAVANRLREQSGAADPADPDHSSDAGKMVTSEPEPVAWAMETAPKDSTMVRLLVRYDHSNMESHPLEESLEPSWTIGFNNMQYDGEDVWQIAGWDWQQDSFTQSAGTPIGWLPFHADPAALLAAEQRGRTWRGMETAPRDGTHILADLGPNFPPTTVHWFADDPALGGAGNSGWHISVQQNDGPAVNPVAWQHLPDAGKMVSRDAGVRIRAVLIMVRRSLEAEIERGVITDTLWLAGSPGETLFDFIGATLAEFPS